MSEVILRKIARTDEYGQLHIDIPAEFGDEFEVIVIRPNQAALATGGQASNGFVEHVLADSAEDVWNEL